MFTGAAMPRSELTGEQMRQVLAHVCDDFEHANIIYQRDNRTVIRAMAAPQTSIIVKLWARPDWRGTLRRLFKMSPADYEWHNLQRFARAGIRVPKPLGFCRVRRHQHNFTDALFLEDLGETTSATEHVKLLIRAMEEKRLRMLEDELIEMTDRMVAAGIVDVDHGLINTVVPHSGEPIRLDLEMARTLWMPSLYWRAYGRMIGHLVSTYAFAVQPNTSRTTDFAQRLQQRLRPSKRTLSWAKKYVGAMMNEQRRVWNIDTRVRLPW